jgi:pilus assembly protein CpaB
VSARRTMILVIALVVGLVAAVALYSYVGSVEDRAYADAKPVEVYVVKKDITKGLPGEEALGNEWIGKDRIPAEYRPTTALADLDVIKGKVAITNLSAGQVLVDGLFVAQNQVPGGTFADRIEKGMVAVSVSIDQVRGVAGNLFPGDRVNIIVTVDNDEGTTELDKTVHHLYQNVRILAIGQSAAPDVGDTAAPTNPGSDLITFEVPAEAAERLVYAGSDTLYLTLVPKDNEPVPVPPIGRTNFFPDTLTPYADEG